MRVASGHYVLVTVTDNGVGMSEVTKSHIFDPFFTTKEPGKGTGLGLAMVYGFMKQTGGYISVYSELNHGTSFKLYFPEVHEVSKPRSSHHGVKPMPSGAETILLVEDDPGVRAITRHTLQACGYRVLEAGNGAEAILRAEGYAGTIHLLLTDVVMPGMGGRLVSKQLQKRKSDIKTLFTSGYTDDAVVRHGVLATKMHFLQKPYSPEALAKKVREVLDEP
jgi:CheY-like chemotaxis protein